MSRTYGEDDEVSSTTPLLGRERSPPVDGNTTVPDDGGRYFDDVPASKRQLGVLSSVSLIFNRMIGTGIYATPSLILRASGSVGLFFTLWLLGALIAAVGMAVFVEFGTGIPRNGGEKNYLEYIYKRPRLLATCCYIMFACMLGWSSANSVVFGEYMVHAFGGQITQWNTRIVGFVCISLVTAIHIFHLNLGLRIQNTLAVVKFGVLIFLVGSGLLASLGLIRLEHKANNFENIWEGTTKDPNAFVSGLYNVLWSFNGYSNAHYALSETKDPVKTIKRAAPIAMMSMTAIYFLVNISYLAVVPKEQIEAGGRVIAALYFGNLFGNIAERVLSIVICMSTFGNIQAVCFSQSRAIQELGREGVIPFSAYFASNAPFNTPFLALSFSLAVNAFWMFVPPPGDAFNFVANVNLLPIAWINLAISGGLLCVYLSRYEWFRASPKQKREGEEWNPPYQAGVVAVGTFFFANVFLFFAPFIPPKQLFRLYDHLPYWSHIAGAAVVIGIGIIYWYIWAKLLPQIGRYRLEREIVIQADGVSRVAIRKIPVNVL
ncbi:hypothetical protein M422DRAFT_261303 [Sphaerobolus stellatus SS14]|uniref:Amino acid transporter n=1 Tax=Sphaerobolus stellatus (strain SS14) TaxID=990650 RepID=A0A0C9U0T0_SPHS4|nr:hypothetical protein M422DRAFT_261303 [Sphaerobolus stellatus SS14]